MSEKLQWAIQAITRDQGASKGELREAGRILLAALRKAKA